MARSTDAAAAGLRWPGRVIRHLIEGPAGVVLRSLSPAYNVVDVLEKRAIDETADYVAAKMPEALALRSREALWDHAMRQAGADGLWLEFGVFKGYSINYMARRTPRRIYGFDSFRGLQEDWKGVGHTRGTFDLDGVLPRTGPNVTLIPGWFRDTVPGFLAAQQAPVSLLHIDCDTFEATAEVLDLIRDRLTPDSVMILDDYHGFWGYRVGQFKAWAEFIAAHDLGYSYSAFNRRSVAICNIRGLRNKLSIPAAGS